MFNRLSVFFEMLKTDPLGFLVYLLYDVIVILISLILHECAHGYVAYRCGDPTAKMLGRLSLNPKAHLDPLGTISMFVIGVGWAKPVPVNPRNFRDYRRDDFLVSIAGIITNLTLFIISSAAAVALTSILWKPEFLSSLKEQGYSYQILLNPFYEGDLNIASIILYSLRPGDWLSVFVQTPWLLYVQRFFLLMAEVNVSLALFNFLPIPPLDGYHIFNDILFKGKLALDRQAFQIAQIALIVLIMTGVLNGFLTGAVNLVYSAVVNLWLIIAGLT